MSQPASDLLGIATAKMWRAKGWRVHQREASHQNQATAMHTTVPI